MATIPRTTAYPQGLVWDDSMSPAYSLPNGGTAPALTAVTTNISGMAYAPGDLGHWAIQIPHDCAPGSDLRLHAHFVFPTQPTAGYKLKWEIYAAVAAVNGTFTESAALTNEYTVVASDADIHRVLDIGTLTAPAAPQSCIIIGRIKRVTPTGDDSDVAPVLLHVDAHYQKGPLGTQGEYA